MSLFFLQLVALEPDFAALCEDRLNGMYAQLCGFLYRVVHAFAAADALNQDCVQGRFPVHWGEQGFNTDLSRFFTRFHQSGRGRLAHAIKHFHLLTSAQAQDTHQIMGRFIR